MTELELRQKAAGILKCWMGAKRGSDLHHYIIDVYNSHKPLPRKVRMSYTMSWCAATVSAVAIAAELTDIMPVECSCAELIRLYKALGRWAEDDGYKPNVGDLILYDWNDDGRGDCTGAPEHVGMVTAVNGDRFTVTEGNMGQESQVGNREMGVNGRYIRGYCCPDYAGKAAALTAEEKKEEAGMKLYRYVNELPYGQGSVTKAIQNGYIKLDASGAMGLWEPNIQTIILMDRAGMLDKPAREV